MWALFPGCAQPPPSHVLLHRPFWLRRACLAQLGGKKPLAALPPPADSQIYPRVPTAQLVAWEELKPGEADAADFSLAGTVAAPKAGRALALPAGKADGPSRPTPPPASGSAEPTTADAAGPSAAAATAVEGVPSHQALLEELALGLDDMMEVEVALPEDGEWTGQGQQQGRASIPGWHLPAACSDGPAPHAMAPAAHTLAPSEPG